MRTADWDALLSPARHKTQRFPENLVVLPQFGILLLQPILQAFAGAQPFDGDNPGQALRALPHVRFYMGFSCTCRAPISSASFSTFRLNPLLYFLTSFRTSLFCLFSWMCGFYYTPVFYILRAEYYKFVALTAFPTYP